VLERVIDTVAVLALVLLVIPLRPGGSDEGLERGALLLAPFALLPVAALVALRRWPARVERLAGALLRPFPERVGALAVRALHRFAEGLGALRGGGHLWWIALHSCVIWLVLSIVPILAAFLALGIEMGPRESLLAAWTTQAAIGVAVALPSAPGFFGIFHYACRLALVRFGVPPETAVAAGTLIHSVMWVTLTLLGLAVLRLRRTSLAELDRAAGGGADPAPPGEPAR
jgi:hypothetical protein